MTEYFIGFIVLLILSCSDKNPTGSADDISGDNTDTRIVFTSTRTGNGDIYIMNEDGLGAVQVTSHSGEDFAPVWSPDKTRIAFGSTRFNDSGEIFIVDADGANTTPFASSSSSNPSWSPDGSKIVYERFNSGHFIYVDNLNSTSSVNLSPVTGGEAEPA